MPSSPIPSAARLVPLSAENSDRYRGLNAAALHVWLVLLPLFDRDVAWPKQTELVEITGRSLRQVVRALRQLEDCGLLTRQTFKGDHRRVAYRRTATAPTNASGRCSSTSPEA